MARQNNCIHRKKTILHKMNIAYIDRPSVLQYKSSEAEERLQVHREAMQRLHAYPIIQRTQTSLQNTQSTKMALSTDTEMSRDSKTEIDLDPTVNEPIAATCVNCMSSSLIHMDKSLICSSCNQSALMPRST